MAFTNLLEVVYPVGAVYYSTVSTSPASLVGGTWTQIKGAVLAATGANDFADVGTYGGSLAMSVDQMPSHYHTATSKLCAIREDMPDYPLQWSASSLKNDNSYQQKRTDSTGGGQELFALPLRFLRLVQSVLASFKEVA